MLALVITTRRAKSKPHEVFTIRNLTIEEPEMFDHKCARSATIEEPEMFDHKEL